MKRRQRNGAGRGRSTTRFWRIGGVLALIGAEAFVFGYSYPFFSLALEKRDLANWLIGLNASVASAGILFVGPFLPRLVHRIGPKYLVVAMFAMSFLAFGAILATDHLALWFAARFVMGACFATLWTTTEIWLNGVDDDRSRGRVIGASGTLYAVCQFLGPVVLGIVGATGSLPPVVAMVPLAIGILVALSIKSIEIDRSEDKAFGDASDLKLARAVPGALVVAAFLCGIGKTAMLSLLPLYGLAHGFDAAGAAGLVAIFILGEVALVAGFSWMADRHGRQLTMRVCVVVALLASALLPFSVGSAVLLWTMLFFAGGTIAGIYALGIVLLGQDFRKRKLPVVSTGFATSFSAGCIVGPVLLGYLTDILGPEALPFSIAVGLLILAVYLFAGRYDAERPEVIADVRSVPNLNFLEDALFEEDPSAPADLSEAQLASKWAPVSGNGGGAPEPARTPPSRLEPEDDCFRHEQDLEAWFRHRAIEIAETLAARQKPDGGRPAPRTKQSPVQAPSPFRPPIERGGGGRSGVEVT
jgi:MFS family permease